MVNKGRNGKIIGLPWIVHKNSLKFLIADGCYHYYASYKKTVKKGKLINKPCIVECVKESGKFYYMSHGTQKIGVALDRAYPGYNKAIDMLNGMIANDK
jgi:hypothetical protein